MTEELEQLLKNLQLRRMLEIYDEQLRAAEKEDVSYSEFVTAAAARPVASRGRRALWPGASSAPACPSNGRWRPSPSSASPASTASRSAPSPSSTSSPRPRTSSSSARPVWARPDSPRAAAQGAAERLPRPVHPRPGSVRRDVRVAGRPLHAATAQPPRPPRRPADRRDGLPQPEARADQHLLQADGGALPPPLHDHHHQSVMRCTA